MTEHERETLERCLSAMPNAIVAVDCTACNYLRTGAYTPFEHDPACQMHQLYRIGAMIRSLLDESGQEGRRS